jgi:nucleoside-diphosphate-sugar epimerase
MSLKGKHVLVTGAGGFIGSHLCERLLTKGVVVRAIVHGGGAYPARYLSSLRAPSLLILGGDIRDASFARECVEGADTVFHLAAVTSVAYSYIHPEETIATNVMGTLNVCEAARRTGVRRLVHVSSAGVYGNARENKSIREDHSVQGCSPYTAGKLGGDFIVDSYCRSYELPATTARLFNAYGPRMGSYLIIPTIVLQALYGDEVKLGDLTPTRNYTYVEDVVTALMRMAEEDAVVGEVVHFGSPEVVSMADLARRILGIVGRDVPVVRDESRLRPEKSEIHHVAADCAKARDLLGWEPKISLDDGLRQTVAWVASGGYAFERQK